MSKGRFTYRALPGSGPAGQTCRSCAATRKPADQWLCGEVIERWGAGAALPIRRSSAACGYWKAREVDHG